jgi:cysteine-S-conjugate beta-lyase
MEHTKKYNFDEIIPRDNTNAIKYDYRQYVFGKDNVLPMWVADMEFKAPDFVAEAIKKRAEHEIYGYTLKPDSFYDSVMSWLKERHGWEIKKNCILTSPGVVAALAIAVLAYTKPGEKIIVQPPVYFPFFEVIEGNNRVVLNNPLIKKDGRLCMDFEHLNSIIDDKTKMLFLCSPHNPGGSVWTKDELTELYSICEKRNIIIVSDEIHSDLVLPGNTHTPFASISKKAAKKTITTIAPSKTFNLAGLSTSVVIISDLSLRRLYNKVLSSMHLNFSNLFGIVALEAAFRNGHSWLSQLIEYLDGNLKFAEEYIQSNMPDISFVRPEATFLLWLDFTNTGLTGKKLEKFVVEKAKLGLNVGEKFGPGGEGHMRLNFGCPRSMLEQGLRQLAEAFKR